MSSEGASLGYLPVKRSFWCTGVWRLHRTTHILDPDFRRACPGRDQQLNGYLPLPQKHITRIGILSNHIHILVGIGVNESPESAALSLLNNLTFAQGWKPVFRFSYYAGTFGGYDRDAIRRTVKEA